MAGSVHGRGHAWGGACVEAGGMHGGGHAWQVLVEKIPPTRYYDIRAMSGRYAS